MTRPSVIKVVASVFDIVRIHFRRPKALLCIELRGSASSLQSRLSLLNDRPLKERVNKAYIIEWREPILKVSKQYNSNARRHVYAVAALHTRVSIVKKWKGGGGGVLRTSAKLADGDVTQSCLRRNSRLSQKNRNGRKAVQRWMLLILMACKMDKDSNQ